MATCSVSSFIGKNDRSDLEQGTPLERFEPKIDTEIDNIKIKKFTVETRPSNGCSGIPNRPKQSILDNENKSSFTVEKEASIATELHEQQNQTAAKVISYGDKQMVYNNSVGKQSFKT